MEYIDSIAQGRIWSGRRGLQLGLVDRLGGLQDAIDCAARMAKVKTYRLKEYPEGQSFLERLLGGYKQTYQNEALQKELGPEGVKLYKTIKSTKEMIGVTQTRIPFSLEIN